MNLLADELGFCFEGSEQNPSTIEMEGRLKGAIERQLNKGIL